MKLKKNATCVPQHVNLNVIDLQLQTMNKTNDFASVFVNTKYRMMFDKYRLSKTCKTQKHTNFFKSNDMWYLSN